MADRRDVLVLIGAIAVPGVLAGVAAQALGAHGADPHSDDVYAALAVYQFEPRQVDEVIRRWETGILAAASQWPGFVRGLLLTNRDAGKGIGMGLWASKADADAFGASAAFQAAAASLGEVLLAPYEREEYAVRFGR
jgi:heme-degrading monooxygenase HmoA